MIPRILIIAGSDSGGGAGIQADIKTVTMLGGHAMTAITAITAQNTLGVSGVHLIPAEMVIAQIDAVVDDIGVDAVKIGMIGSAETANAVADRLERFDNVPIVFDPVMVATSGAVLADEATIAAFGKLMQMATVITPNALELQALTGSLVDSVKAMEEAAGALHASYGCAILAKGGHVIDRSQPGRVTDILVDRSGTIRWYGERLDSAHTHGTGCTLASATAAGLGGGLAPEVALDRARAYVIEALKMAPGLGEGNGPVGHTLGLIPFHHLVAARDPEGWGVAAFDAKWSPPGAPLATGRKPH